MNDYQMKDMTGTSFRNENKESENHADVQGTIMVNGVEYWLNTWSKTSQKTGKKFWSHSIRPKTAQAAAKPAAKAKPEPEFDDDMPF